jgi:hypothetical protein
MYIDMNRVITVFRKLGTIPSSYAKRGRVELGYNVIKENQYLVSL